MTRTSSDLSMRVDPGPRAGSSVVTRPLSPGVTGSGAHIVDPAIVQAMPGWPLSGTPEAAGPDSASDVRNLTASAALDLSLLISVLNRNLNLLAEEWLSPTGHDALLSLAAATSYLRGLTHELCSASTEGDSRIKVRHVRLDSWWPNMEWLLQAVHGEGVVILGDIPPELPCVCIKPRHLTQVIFALVGHASSAIAASATGPEVSGSPARASDRGEIKISARPAGCGRSIHLTVADNSAGMTPAAVAHAFEPSASFKRGHRGVGHSMARVRRLVGAIGGRVHLTSSLGSGTTVSLELPTPDGAETDPREFVVG